MSNNTDHCEGVKSAVNAGWPMYLCINCARRYPPDIPPGSPMVLSWIEPPATHDGRGWVCDMRIAREVASDQ